MKQRDIFIEALQKTEGKERRIYLDAACGDDVELRNSVEELLAEHQKDESFFLDAPPPGLGATVDMPTITEKPGKQIGPYKLLQQIGEGGMGTVFMAEQTEPVQRRVALKIIKPGMDTQQVIARFEAERQTLAMMDHPNIAKVLDAGQTDSGRPFFVMELVKGIPVTQYCDEQHLSPKERLELFVPICQAVQHAHQKGIIHRDLKPSNILIAQYDDKPVAKVIDFGVAKATSQKLTEKTMFTQYGQIVGTIEYMSPEQARFNQLDVDTRSDIYSLGVLLYELLTGETPFDRTRLHSAAFDELLRIIREEEPPRMSTRLSSSETLPNTAINRSSEPKKLSVLVRGELDWIVMKALDKDRARRYETASKFVEDIQRYLHDEPVTACPPTAMYRLRKFARRHRPAMVTAGIVASALVVGLLGTFWQMIRAKHAERDARTAQAIAEERLVLSEERFLLARDAVDEMLSRVAEERLRNVPAMETVRRDLLEEARNFYQKFLQQRSSDASVRMAAAVAHQRLAEVHLLLEDHASASMEAQEAVRLLQNLLRSPETRNSAILQLARTHFLLAELSREEGDLPSARKRLEKSIKLLETASQVNSAAGEFARERARHLMQVSKILSQEGTRSEAQARLSDAERVLRELEAQEQLDEKCRLALVRVLGTTGNFGLIEGKLDIAEDRFREVVQLAEQDAASNSVAPDLRRAAALAYNNLAQVFHVRNEYDQASERYDTSLDEFRKLVRDFPYTPDLQLDLAGVLMSAGINSELITRGTGNVLIEEALDVLQALTQRYPTIVQYRHVLGGALHDLASRLHRDGGDLARAEDLIQQAIAHQTEVLEKTPRDPNPNMFLVKHYRLLAEIRENRGDAAGSVLACDQTLQLADQLRNELPGNAQLEEIIQDARRLKQFVSRQLEELSPQD